MEDIGVHELVFDFRGADIQDSLKAMSNFSETIMAKLK